MSVGRILTLGFGSFGGVHFLPTLGYGTGATQTPVTPSTGAGSGSAARRRRIVLRINGELRSADDLEQVLEVLSAVKKDIRETARAAAEEIVSSGKRVGEARKAQETAIQVVDAPYSVRDMIQTRIDEVQKLFWRRVEACLREMEDDDEVMAVL